MPSACRSSAALFGHHLPWFEPRPQTWIELVLTLPIVLWAGQPFFVRGWHSVRNLSPNMWTLIGLGTGAALVRPPLPVGLCPSGSTGPMAWLSHVDCRAAAATVCAPRSSANSANRRRAATRRLIVFVERLWRSVKYADIYLRAYETPAALRAGLTRYFDFYNGQRRHAALDRRTPDAVYFDADAKAAA